MKYYELKKDNHLIGLSNSYHDLPLLKKHIKLGYKITKITLVTNEQDAHGRIIARNIIL